MCASPWGSCKIPQPTKNPIQHFLRSSPSSLKCMVRHSVLVPQVFHHLHEHTLLGLESSVAQALELELMLQFIGQFLEVGFALPNVFFEGRYDLLLRLQSLELLPRGFAGATLEVVNQLF